VSASELLNGTDERTEPVAEGKVEVREADSEWSPASQILWDLV
jgi:hypothetical protein